MSSTRMARRCICSERWPSLARRSSSGICTTTWRSAQRCGRSCAAWSSRCSMMIAVSRSIATDARKALPHGPSVAVIHNAVDTDVFTPHGPALDLAALSGLPPPPTGAMRVGLVATFAHWKGHDVFLQAAASVAGTHRFYVVGGPIYATGGSQWSLEELRARAAALGLADRVGFTGFVEDVPAAMRGLDVVVHASTEPEPFGLVILQAMACARPVIVTAVGGACELIAPGGERADCPGRRQRGACARHRAPGGRACTPREAGPGRARQRRAPFLARAPGWPRPSASTRTSGRDAAEGAPCLLGQSLRRGGDAARDPCSRARRLPGDGAAFRALLRGPPVVRVVRALHPCDHSGPGSDARSLDDRAGPAKAASSHRGAAAGCRRLSHAVEPGDLRAGADENGDSPRLLDARPGARHPLDRALGRPQAARSRHLQQPLHLRQRSPALSPAQRRPTRFSTAR